MTKIKHFADLERLDEDPILGLQVRFNDDKRPDKLNLSIGVYKDSDGQLALLDSVKQAGSKLVINAKNYLPIDGDIEFNRLVTEFIFEDTAGENRIMSFQAIGATGALSLIATLLKLQGFNKIAVPSPSWPNHALIFSRAGLNPLKIPYYDEKLKGINEAAFIENVSSLGEDTALVLQAGCHNPTGIDPDRTLWTKLAEIVKKKRLFPLFDLAYHGFKHSLQEDLFPIRLFSKKEIEFGLAYSFSKNMALYGERVGIGFILCESFKAKLNALSQMKKIIRSRYSSPQLYGAQIVKTILKSKELKSKWKDEIKAMRERIHLMKTKLKKAFEDNDLDGSLFEKTFGLFSLLDLTKDEILKLREDYAIYLLEDGRLNFAALTENNLDTFVQAYKKMKKK